MSVDWTKLNHNKIDIRELCLGGQIGLQHQFGRGGSQNLNDQVCVFPFLLICLVFKHLCVHFPGSVRPTDEEVYLKSKHV